MKRIFLLAIAIWMAAAAQAQIGYKGQMSMELLPGMTHTGDWTGPFRLGTSLSEHSNLGAGVWFDHTTYDASMGDSFGTSQWMGAVDYRYALPVNRFIFMPGGGLLLGGEQSDAVSKLGNLLPYANQFIYGMAVNLGIEYVLSRSWALVAEPRLHYLFKTHFDNLKLSINVGIKCYF